MDLLNPENFEVHEVTENEFQNWVKSEFHDTHPVTLIERTFPEHVMEPIARDHHKSRDGAFSISYDHWSKKWYVKHPGYVRECEAVGDTYLEAASNFLSLIDRENARFRYHAIEDAANQRLPDHLSVEFGEGTLTLYECKEGENNTRLLTCTDIEGKTVEEVVAIVNKTLSEYATLVD